MLLFATLILLLATGLQVTLAGQPLRLHGDEAFFLTFARRTTVQGDWLLPGPLDKPPLSMYLNALALMFLGVDSDSDGVLFLDPLKGEFAARIMGVWLAVMAVALLMALAKRLYRRDAIVLSAGLLAALSPFWIAFGATAFTDMPMLCALLAAFWYVSRQRWTAGGVLFALAFAARPQAIYALPLIILLMLPSLRRAPIRFLIPVLTGGVLLLIWDSLRPETSVFLLGAVNNAPENSLSPVADWIPRLRAWLEIGQYLAGDALITALLSGVTLVTVLLRPRRVNLAIVAWITGYALLHVIVPVNIYDRYLLPLVPALILLAAWSLNQWRGALMLVCISALLLLPGAYMASRGALPIGGDGGRSDAINEMADYLASKPVATVIYDRWLGWQMDYYMGSWSDKRRVYYPTATDLVRGALALPEGDVRYFIAPRDEQWVSWLIALERAGFRLNLDWQQGRFVVFALTPPAYLARHHHAERALASVRHGLNPASD